MQIILAECEHCPKYCDKNSVLIISECMRDRTPAQTLLSGRDGAPQASWSPGLPRFPPPAATIRPAAAPPVWTAGATRHCLGSLQDHRIRGHTIINCRRAPG